MMPKSRSMVVLALAVLLHGRTAAGGDAPAISADVQAVLDQHCVKCHGPLEDKAGLRLDTAAGVWKGSDNGLILKAGKPDESKLLAVLTRDADPHMPPKKQAKSSPS